MFEYLMPQLMMPSYENTLLEQTCKAAVSRQIEYARQRAACRGASPSRVTTPRMPSIPINIGRSECPGLGFKRGLGDDLVIAPYASALALTVMPREACRNLQTLAANGFLGVYGFYEAIDYTPSRVPRGMDHAIVRTFMAHHQGMSLLAFVHVLARLGRCSVDSWPTRSCGRRNCCCRSVCRRRATLHPHAAEVSAAARPGRRRSRYPSCACSPTPTRRFPRCTCCRTAATTSWRPTPVAATAAGATSPSLAGARTPRATAGAHSSTCAIATPDATGRPRHQPTLRKPDHYEAIFVQARAEYRRRDHGDRNAHRDQRVTRRRRRDPPGHAHQPVIAYAPHRGDELCRGGAGAA